MVCRVLQRVHLLILHSCFPPHPSSPKLANRMGQWAWGLPHMSQTPGVVLVVGGSAQKRQQQSPLLSAKKVISHKQRPKHPQNDPVVDQHKQHKPCIPGVPPTKCPPTPPRPVRGDEHQAPDRHPHVKKGEEEGCVDRAQLPAINHRIIRLLAVVRHSTIPAPPGVVMHRVDGAIGFRREEHPRGLVGEEELTEQSPQGARGVI